MHHDVIMPMEHLSPCENKFISQARLIVEQHIDNEEFTAYKLAEALEMNRMTLHRQLKRLTHLSCTAFIRKIRLTRAKEMLGNPGVKVIDVGFAVGFTHMSYFARCFKRVYGQTPSAYIKTIGEV